MNETNLKELLTTVEESVKSCNNTIATNDYLQVKKAKVLLQESVKEYNEAVKSEYFKKLLGASNPYKEALEKLEYGIKKAVFKNNDGVERADIEDSVQKVVLYELEKASPKKLAVNCNWIFKIEKFASLMTARVVKEVGSEEDQKRYKSFYKIQQAAQNCDIGAVPTSNNQTVKTMQSIVDDIIFTPNEKGENEYKVVVKDALYLQYLLFGRGKKLYSIKAPSFGKMQELLTDVLSRVVTKSEYSVEFETIDSSK